MADRCDHCSVRMDGHEVHADDCPVRGPEIVAENEDLKTELEVAECQADQLRVEVDRLKQENADVARDLAAARLQVGEYGKVLEGCKDVFVQFCGESAPVIAHPPKCRFYIQGRPKDCTCTAKNTANDILLSLKACRAILEGKTQVQVECLVCWVFRSPCPSHRSPEIQ